MRSSCSVLASLLCCVSLSSLTQAQGEFVNFETQPIKPMAIAAVDGREFLLVCNTPDNSVEIYDTIDNRFVQRVPVGLRPISVQWRPILRQFYTVNFLGDSVTAVDILPDSGLANNKVARVSRTTNVGDEPTDLLFLPGDGSFFVLLNSSSAMGWFSSKRMIDILGGLTFPLTFPLLDPTADKALKEPRRILMNGTICTIMGMKGGNNPASYDYDVYQLNLANSRQMAIDGLGSTNFNMAVAKDRRLFVVGTRAQNQVQGEPLLSQEQTGFVQSHLYVVENPNAFVIDRRISDRDLNRDAGGGIVPHGLAISSPTDLVLLESDSGRVVKVFVTGFDSDRLIVLHNNGETVDKWPANHIDIANMRSADGYGRSGPRALLLSNPQANGTTPQPISMQRLYCFNSLNQTVSVIDPLNEVELARFKLHQDPTPKLIRRGREFLYSADISGNGFSSCASCHIDGRTDNLTWNLGIPGGGPGNPIPKLLIDGAPGVIEGSNFDTDKGPFFTQSLQGLVDHPVFSQAQWLMSNAPYHWRGDKGAFRDFNGTFVNLMGAANIGTPDDPKGLTDVEMGDFEVSVLSIMYPPNPAQPKDRRYSGQFGDPDLEDGSGALRGLKLFHTRGFPGPITLGRSCVQCHALPEGSNNRITESILQPLETAAMRGFVQKEARLENSQFSLSTVQTAEFGLTHTGIGELSMNGFMQTFFAGFFNGQKDKLFDLIAFSREMDWGVAPLIGAVATIDRAQQASTTAKLSFALAESQVLEANVGLAVHAILGGAEHGYYFDITVDPPAYREAGTSNLIRRGQLLAAMIQSGDRLILQATEAGSERRAASLTGIAPPIPGPAPSQITLQPMRPGTAWRDVPDLTKNWRKGTGPNDFIWGGGNTTPEPKTLKAMRIFQLALMNKAPHFGVRSQRHDPPRRFRVAGNEIRPGAALWLLIPAELGVAPPYSGNEETHALRVELFPTPDRTNDGRQIWESAAEVDQLMTYGLLLGGPWAPQVGAAVLGNLTEPPLVTDFDPLGWNWYKVGVANADGTYVDAGWQRLTIQ